MSNPMNWGDTKAKSRLIQLKEETKIPAAKPKIKLHKIAKGKRTSCQRKGGLNTIKTAAKNRINAVFSMQATKAFVNAKIIFGKLDLVIKSRFESKTMPEELNTCENKFQTTKPEKTKRKYGQSKV